MTTINWQFLLDNIENKQCILCLGPDFFTESGSEKRRYEQELSDFLRRHEKELRIRVYDNGWFHYLPGHNKLSVWKKLEEFYKQNNAEAAAILEKIADLPFEAVISFTPDYRVSEAFKAKRPDTQFKSFQKNVPCEADKPNLHNPLIFNLLGELQKGNSLVLTYTDCYAYLKSVFDEKSIPIVLQDKISDARHFIFLGLPFDRWYTHLFMNIINTYVNQKDEIHRVAANQFIKPEDMETASEQHALTFINEDIGAFVTALHQRCQAKNLFVAAQYSKTNPLSKFDLWRQGIKSGIEDTILKVLDEMADYMEGSEDKLNTIILLTGQYNQFLSKKRRGLFETNQAEKAAEGTVLNGILSTISNLEKES